MPLDLSKYVTRDELDGRLDPLGEIRDMLRDDMRGLHEGQAAQVLQIATMNKEICARMDEANGRTSKLETRMEAQDKLLEAGKGHIEDVETTVHKILEDGCHQIKNHTNAVDTLAQVGAILKPNDVARVGFRDGKMEYLDDRPVLFDSDEGRPLRRLAQRHPKKTAALGGGALVGFGALLPHLWEWFHWVIHLFVKASQ